MEKRYIFLDIDGVLNCDEYYNRLFRERTREEISLMDHHDYNLDEQRIQLLNQLAPAEVVLITSWPTNVCRVWLPKKGLELPIIGAVTPRELQYRWLVRGNSIAEWFIEHYGDMPMDSFLDSFEKDGWWHPESNGDVAVTYVILDDSADMLMDQKNHFLHINPHTGLTQAYIDKAKQILHI